MLYNLINSYLSFHATRKTKTVVETLNNSLQRKVEYSSLSFSIYMKF